MARELLAEAEPLVHASGDVRCLFDLYGTLGDLDLAARDLDGAVAHFRKHADYAQNLDAWSVAMARGRLGGALYEAGELEEAEAFLVSGAALAYVDRAAVIAREADAVPITAMALTARGFYAMASGRHDEARAAFAAALQIALDEDIERELSELVDHIAVLSAAEDRVAAGRLYAPVTARRAAIRNPRLERDFPVYERVLDGAVLDGDVLEWDEAIALARSLVEPALD